MNGDADGNETYMKTNEAYMETRTKILNSLTSNSPFRILTFKILLSFEAHPPFMYECAGNHAKVVLGDIAQKSLAFRYAVDAKIKHFLGKRQKES